MADREQLRSELESSLAARRELGEELEPHLVESFLDRIEQRLTERQAPKPPAPTGLGSDQRTGIAVVSIIAAIPLIAIASGAGVPGVALVCLALVLVNVVASR